jgi:hypothetical protein
LFILLLLHFTAFGHKKHRLFVHVGVEMSFKKGKRLAKSLSFKKSGNNFVRPLSFFFDPFLSSTAEVFGQSATPSSSPTDLGLAHCPLPRVKHEPPTPSPDIFSQDFHTGQHGRFLGDLAPKM